MFKADIMHAGLRCTAKFIEKKKVRVFVLPKVGIFYLSSVFKEKALCGTLLTGYFFDGVTIEDESKPFDMHDLKESFIGVSWCKGTRPTYYTDDGMFRSMPGCVFSEYGLSWINCPQCLDHTRFPLWTLSKVSLC